MSTWKGKHPPQVIAAVFSRAAALVDRHGYDGTRFTRITGEPYSATLAVERAAAEIFAERQGEFGTYTVNALELAEDAHDRLSGLLAFTGLADGNPPCVEDWDAAGHTRQEAIAMLGLGSFAAGFITRTAGNIA